MPTSATFGGFNFGRDGTFVLMHPLAPNGRVDMTGLMSFDAKEEYHTVTKTFITGKTLEQFIPKNWKGSFDIVRGGAGLDTLQSGIDLGWYTGGVMFFGRAYQYVTEIDGSVTTFCYDDVAIKVTDSGKWEGDKEVMQKVEFTASSRKRI